MPQANAGFHPRLREIATIVWRKTRRVTRTVYAVKGEAVNEPEVAHYADVAAFLAYSECEGDPDCYDTYDWDANWPNLVQRAHHHMLQLLRRTDQSYDVDRLPLKRRTEVVANDVYCWKIWEQPITGRVQGTPTGGHDDGTLPDSAGSQRQRHEYAPAEPEQERQLVEAMLMELGTVLAQSLSQKDFDLLEKHYFRGRSQRDLASELGLTENALNVRMNRVRERARKALEARSPEWKDIFNDLV